MVCCSKSVAQEYPPPNTQHSDDLAQQGFSSRTAFEPSSILVNEAMARGTSLTALIREPKTSAIAALVMDDPLFPYATGGMLVKNGLALDASSIDDISQSVKFAARLGSWKCWLSGLPLGGGKIIVATPQYMNEQELCDLFAWIGDQFQDVDFYGKPDVGVTPAVLDAYAQAGGKVSTADVNLAVPLNHEKLHWKRIAVGVVDGIDEALRLEFNRSLSESKVLLVGARGKIGQEILQLLRKHGADITLVVRDLNAQQWAQHAGLPFCSWDELALEPAEILVWAGPPFGLGERSIRALRAGIVAGPANDVVDSPKWYGLGKTIIPGAVLTSAAMYAPSTIPGLENLNTPTYEEVGNNSREIVRRVYRRRADTYQNSNGKISLFDAFVLEGESSRKECAARARLLGLRPSMDPDKLVYWP